MEPRDAGRLAEIEKECFSDPWSENAFLTECGSPSALFLVYEEDGEIAGYAGALLVFDEVQIANVAVRESFRRRGIARALLAELEAEARAAGGCVMQLEVRASNAGAIALYRGFGFEPVGVRRNFYSLPREDAVLMDKRIG